MNSDTVARPIDHPVSRGEARRRAFLEAAREVFLDEGYEAASVNEIVRRAGGSLATLYAQFGNKDGLFLAVLEEGTEKFVAPMAEAADPGRPLEEGLQEIGETFLSQLIEPNGLSFFRMVVTESRKFPELFEKVVSHGPDRVRATVAAYLAARADEDGCAFEDADAAAAFFCEMVRGRHLFRALGDTGYTQTPEEIRAYVAKAVRFFLNGARRP